MKFHRRVPSFSFTSFTFNNNNNSSNSNNNNNNDNDNDKRPSHPKRSPSTQSQSQPNSPSQPHFDIPILDPPPQSAVPLRSNQLQLQQQQHQHQHQHQHQQQQKQQLQLQQPSSSSTSLTSTSTSTSSSQSNQQYHRHSSSSIIHRRNTSITLLLSPDDPLKLIVQQPDQPHRSSNRRHRSGSLVERPTSSSLSPIIDRISPQLDHNPIPPHDHPTHSPSVSHFSRHRKRLSNLFSPLSSYYTSSRSPSPAHHPRSRSSNASYDPSESDRDSNIDSNSLNPNIDLPSSDSDDESDSTHSTSDRSTDLDQEDLSESGHNDLTILANTNANASSVTPIDFLQKSNQPIPFIDQAPNLTSPPPLPISFVPTDPRFPSSTLAATSAPNRKSIRRRSSIKDTRNNLELTVSRPIYQKNRCTITIEHGNWSEAAKKAERTRFYLVACDLSDESKYAIEWTIGTVLRQGDECLIIMIIETDSKFDPEDGAGSAADRTAKIRNQKDRQEKATLLVREATALLERTGLNCKVTCQAIHGKNPKHMLIDCIDYLEPNLVIVGRRGMTSSKNSLMGSVSHYLLHKSSVPVMVARRRMRTLPKVYKKKSGLVSQSPVKLTEASIEKSTPISPANTLTTNTDYENKRLSVVNEETDMRNQLSQLLLSEDGESEEALGRSNGVDEGSNPTPDVDGSNKTEAEGATPIESKAKEPTLEPILINELDPSSSLEVNYNDILKEPHLTPKPID